MIEYQTVQNYFTDTKWTIYHRIYGTEIEHFLHGLLKEKIRFSLKPHYQSAAPCSFLQFTLVTSSIYFPYNKMNVIYYEKVWLYRDKVRNLLVMSLIFLYIWYTWLESFLRIIRLDSIDQDFCYGILQFF